MCFGLLEAGAMRTASTHPLDEPHYLSTKKKRAYVARSVMGYDIYFRLREAYVHVW